VIDFKLAAVHLALDSRFQGERCFSARRRSGRSEARRYPARHHRVVEHFADQVKLSDVRFLGRAGESSDVKAARVGAIRAHESPRARGAQPYLFGLHHVARAPPPSPWISHIRGGNEWTKGEERIFFPARRVLGKLHEGSSLCRHRAARAPAAVSHPAGGNAGGGSSGR